MRAAEQAWAAMQPLLRLRTHLGTFGHGNDRPAPDARLLYFAKAATYKQVHDYNHTIKAGKGRPHTYDEFATLADMGIAFWRPTLEEHAAAVTRIEADARNWTSRLRGLVPVTHVKARSRGPGKRKRSSVFAVQTRMTAIMLT